MKNFNELSKDVNNILKNNKDVKDMAGRNAIVKKHDNLLFNIKENMTHVDQSTVSGAHNRFYSLLKVLTNWIASGKDTMPKQYKTKLKDENPTELKDNLNTNYKIKNIGSNYYVKGDLKPTKSELKNKYINQLNSNLKEARIRLKQNRGNRILASQDVKAAKDDLDEAIRSHRGINQTGRVDNTVTPKTGVNLPTFKNRGYVKYLLTTSPEEMKDINLRLDKADIDNMINKDQVMRYLELGYTQSKIAALTGLSQSTVSREIKNTTKKIVTE